MDPPVTGPSPVSGADGGGNLAWVTQTPVVLPPADTPPERWLMVASFFIAQGFLVTGLGERVALMFVSRLGRSSLGLSYGMALTDLILAPATPSNTARAGGVVYPIIVSRSARSRTRSRSRTSRASGSVPTCS
jgi:divalent anion:Na+ symporter, DASS family